MGSSKCPGPALGWCSGVKCLSLSQGIALKCLLSQRSSKFCNCFFSCVFFNFFIQRVQRWSWVLINRLGINLAIWVK